MFSPLHQHGPDLPPWHVLTSAYLTIKKVNQTYPHNSSLFWRQFENSRIIMTSQLIIPISQLFQPSGGGRMVFSVKADV